MDELDRRFSSSPQRIPLRWDLLQQLLSANDLAAYSEQARRFMADPLTRFEEHGAAILETLHAVYQRISRSACEKVIAAAHAGLQQRPELKSTWAACRCQTAADDRHAGGN